MRQSESCVLILRNMVGPEDVVEALQEEITEKCARFGQVQHVIICQERQSDRDDVEIIVKIFVEVNSRKGEEIFFGVSMCSGDLFGLYHDGHLGLLPFSCFFLHLFTIILPLVPQNR